MPSRVSPGKMLALLLVVAVSAGAGALLAIGLSDGEDGDHELPDHWQRGVNLTAFLPGAYGSETAQRAMLTARSTGTEVVVLTPTSYMQTAASEEVFADPAKTPTDASVLAAAEEARSLGLGVVIKPHVDVQDGTFRGEISPADRGAWFDNYGELVDRYAEIATRVDADAFVIGTELTSMTSDEAAWRSLIERARDRYDGPIVFAANWVDGAEQINFWDALDAIGIDGYMPLGDDSDPSVDDLVEQWGPYAARMVSLHDRWDLPVLFTELGYESRLGTAARIDQGAAPLSETAQADAYEAAFEALSPLPWFRGIWWWEWSAEGLGIGGDDGGFSPEGKAAADVLADWQTQ